MQLEALNVLASHFVMLLLFFEKSVFITLLVFLVGFYVISIWNHVKNEKLGYSLPNAPTDPPRPASTVTVQANNLSHSMQIANAA